MHPPSLVTYNITEIILQKWATHELVPMHPDNEFLPAASMWQASASLLTALQHVFNITQRVFQTNCLSCIVHATKRTLSWQTLFEMRAAYTKPHSLTPCLSLFCIFFFSHVKQETDFSQSVESSVQHHFFWSCSYLFFPSSLLCYCT